MLAETLRFMLLSLTFSVLKLPLAAQTSPLTDSWVLFDQISISGKLYSNAVPRQINLRAGTDSIHFENLEMGQQGEDIIEKEYALLATPIKMQLSEKAMKEIIVQQPVDRNAFTIYTNIYSTKDSSKPVYKQTDQYTLQGHQLILMRKAENTNNGETWECKAVYERREI